jgi:threonine dehydrogenase-like Zn-dependent dehydrogenase
VDGRAIVTREIEIKGSYAYGFEDFSRALSMLSEKKFPVDSVVSRATLPEGQAIFDDLASGETSMIKVVFEL